MTGTRRFSRLRRVLRPFRQWLRTLATYNHDRIFACDLPLRLPEPEHPQEVMFRELLHVDAPGLEQVMRQADEFQRGLVERRFRSGDRVWGVFLGGRIVHYDFVTFRDRWLDIVEQSFPLQEREAFIYNCHTLERWRGQGLYPFALWRLLQLLENIGVNRCYIDVAAHNVPSIKGILKVGFRHYESRVQVLVLRKTVWRYLSKKY